MPPTARTRWLPPASEPLAARVSGSLAATSLEVESVAMPVCPATPSPWRSWLIGSESSRSGFEGDRCQVDPKLSQVLTQIKRLRRSRGRYHKGQARRPPGHDVAV